MLIGVGGGWSWTGCCVSGLGHRGEEDGCRRVEEKDNNCCVSELGHRGEEDECQWVEEEDDDREDAVSAG